MVIRPDQFWGSNYYNHPSLTNEMILFAEQRLGVKLPAEYIALLRIQNGGYTLGFGYPMQQPTTWAEDHVPLEDLAGIVTDPDHETALNILDTAYMTKEWGLPDRQVLLSGEGHWWITLDYRNGAVPSVAWIDVEDGEDVQVAPSFAAFLNGLRPASEFDATKDEPADAVGFLWRPASIRFAIERDDEFLKIGQYLRLEQGWQLMRIDIPETWVVSHIGFVENELRLSLSDGRVFKLGPSNIGRLSFAILDGGPKSDGQLEVLWGQHAS